ncbi:WD repeat-containing protein 7 [Plutella xylostella]|uniref:WD repeat-containing protein 7 n=1 Tax=Plutella xylostella TaxID=51655 RepID=UPI0020327335|nr:WD repeat-containing protein 7 [Plutella xylostella]
MSYAHKACFCLAGAAGNKRRKEGDSRKSSVVEGFALSSSNNLARLTALALTHLLLAPGTPRLPAHTPLRRAAVDLLGRGFTVWEPYLDVSHVLLGLLEMCSDADKLLPSMSYGLPLTPQADSCRTARHALTLIATARPAAFITTMAREVARCAAAQQSGQPSPAYLALQKGRAEVLRGIELLIDRMHNEVAELLVEVMDIILHCVDQSHLKSKGLNEVFPAICRYNQVSHCPATRRIAVGSHTGQLAMYELRAGRCQSLAAHSGPVSACAFSPDGRYLVSYATADNRLSFWQTTAGMFGLGAAQTRCVKCYSTAPMADVARLNPARLARLVWTTSRAVTLMLADGSETRFNV